MKNQVAMTIEVMSNNVRCEFDEEGKEKLIKNIEGWLKTEGLFGYAKVTSFQQFVGTEE